MGDGLRVTCEGWDAERGALLAARAAAAADALELAGELDELRICLDDVPGDDDGWLTLARTPDRTRPPRLTLYGHVAAVCGGPAAAGLLPRKEVWDAAGAPGAEEDAGPFHPARADVFLHHQLLTARDLVRGELRPADVPAGQAEAFGVLWAVTVDGRLARWGLPGYPMAERRARFSRRFSSAGILMPGHWQAFEALWDGALAAQKDVLSLVARLPRLKR